MSEIFRAISKSEIQTVFASLLGAWLCLYVVRR